MEEEDYLEVDRPIPGQNFVCLSFVSPDKVLEDKKLYSFYKYSQSLNNSNQTFTEFKDKFEEYSDLHNKEYQDEFDKICDYQTNVRGVKIRGVYDNERAANIRAQVLQKMDNSFHVYVGQVGYWLPWDPNPNNVENQEYLNNDLNRLVKEYDNNQTKKDMFYEEQKRDRKEAAIKETLEKKKKLEEQRKLELEANEQSGSGEQSESGEQSGSGEHNDLQENIKLENEEIKELSDNLNEEDPWMKRKLEESNK